VATYAALPKESRMKSTEATVFDRKSGGGEGPAVRPGSRTKVSVPLVPRRLVVLRGCDFIDYSREVIDLNEFVIPTGAKRSGGTCGFFLVLPQNRHPERSASQI
jgi:hypothetical protein